MKSSLAKCAEDGLQRDDIPAGFVAVMADDFSGSSRQRRFESAREWLQETIFGDF